MLKREIKITQDGSKTLYIPDWNESYHSKHGALREAEHVFITNGLEKLNDSNMINVLEYGFGTGLNALLSFIWSRDHSKSINYTSLEKFPVSTTEVEAMDFHQVIAQKYSNLQADPIYEFFLKMHQAKWEEKVNLTDFFELFKQEIDFKEVRLKEETYDVVFFDVFGMRVQPELWSEEIFEKIYTSLKIDGLFTTYACNGPTKRALKACGFRVEKLAGPPGKREMINAWKK